MHAACNCLTACTCIWAVSLIPSGAVCALMLAAKHHVTCCVKTFVQPAHTLLGVRKKAAKLTYHVPLKIRCRRYIYALASCSLQASYLLLVERSGAEKGIGTVELLLYNSILSIPFLLVVSHSFVHRYSHASSG